jgi:hypothetical protein
VILNVTASATYCPACPHSEEGVGRDKKSETQTGRKGGRYKGNMHIVVTVMYRLYSYPIYIPYTFS